MFIQSVKSINPQVTFKQRRLVKGADGNFYAFDDETKKCYEVEIKYKEVDNKKQTKTEQSLLETELEKDQAALGGVLSVVEGVTNDLPPGVKKNMNGFIKLGGAALAGISTGLSMFYVIKVGRSAAKSAPAKKAAGFVSKNITTPVGDKLSKAGKWIKNTGIYENTIGALSKKESVKEFVNTAKIQYNAAKTHLTGERVTNGLAVGTGSMVGVSNLVGAQEGGTVPVKENPENKDQNREAA
ncbi:MAG: hypothetical protein LBK53_01320 [Heliobacteriaceae bacterium]|jgi:hypothetical protein|nr:hypothetical protein [Heliobacteriaceae bacterium]